MSTFWAKALEYIVVIIAAKYVSDKVEQHLFSKDKKPTVNQEEEGK